MNISPSTKRTWVATIIVIIGLYIFYYGVLFKPLVNIYKEQYYVIPFVCEKKECSINDIKVFLVLSKHLRDVEMQSAYVKIVNASQNSVHFKLKLIVNDDDDIETIKKLPLILNTSDHEADTLIRDGLDLNMKPYESVFAEFPFLLQGKSINAENVVLYWESVNTSEFETKTSPVSEKLLPDLNVENLTVSQVSSSFHDLLNKVVLPPLANGIIPLLGLISCWLVENNVNSQVDADRKMAAGKKDKREISVNDDSKNVESANSNASKGDDENDVFSEKSAKIIIKIVLFGGLLSISVMVFFFISEFFSSPALFFLAPFVVIGVWRLYGKNLTNFLSQISGKHFSFLNINREIAVIIFLILVISFISNLQYVLGVFRDKVYLIMDDYDQFKFNTDYIILLSLYSISFLVAFKLAWTSKSKSSRNNKKAKSSSQQAIEQIDKRKKSNEKANRQGSELREVDIKNSLPTKDAQDIEDIPASESVQSDDIHKTLEGLQNTIPKAINAAHESFTALANLEGMNIAVNNMAASDLIPKNSDAQTDEIIIASRNEDSSSPLTENKSTLLESFVSEKTDGTDSVLGKLDADVTKYWCSNCGKFYGEKKPEKCKECPSVEFQTFDPNPQRN